MCFGLTTFILPVNEFCILKAIERENYVDPWHYIAQGNQAHANGHKIFAESGKKPTQAFLFIHLLAYLNQQVNQEND
jgi:hypothetical protein